MEGLWWWWVEEAANKKMLGKPSLPLMEGAEENLEAAGRGAAGRVLAGLLPRLSKRAQKKKPYNESDPANPPPQHDAKLHRSLQMRRFPSWMPSRYQCDRPRLTSL
jgi:hypothetical protein